MLEVAKYEQTEGPPVLVHCMRVMSVREHMTVAAAYLAAGSLGRRMDIQIKQRVHHQ